MYQTVTKYDTFLKSTYGDWFRMDHVVSFSIEECTHRTWYIQANLQTGRCYHIGPASHESREKAVKWLAGFMESISEHKREI